MYPKNKTKIQSSRPHKVVNGDHIKTKYWSCVLTTHYICNHRIYWHRFNIQQSNYDLQLNTIWHGSSIYRDLTTVYTNENWFIILLSCVHFGDWVTEIWHFSPLKTNNSVQLRTPWVPILGRFFITDPSQLFTHSKLVYWGSNVIKTLSRRLVFI